jgi:hypothetical protein
MKAAAVTIAATLDSAGRVSEGNLKTDIRRGSRKL